MYVFTQISVIMIIIIIIIISSSSSSIYYCEYYSNVHLINNTIFNSSSYCDYGVRKVPQYLQATFKGFCLQH